MKNQNNPVSGMCDAGLHLVPIPKVNGKPSKAPRAKGWNKPKSTDNTNGYSSNADDFSNLKDCNFGVYHQASNTLALDLDNLEMTCKVFSDAADIQLLDWLKDNTRVEIKSPKKNRGKLLYKVPPESDFELKQFKFDGEVIFELRVGNCQDVIYGQHPEGGNYQLIGDPQKIPPAPEILLDMLNNWDDWKPCLDSALGVEQTIPIAPKQLPQNTPHGWRNPIAEFNQSQSVRGVLLRNGYIAKGKNRFIRPNSTSKAPAVAIMTNCTDGIQRVYSHGGDVLNDGYAHDAFDCFRLLEHNGEW